MALRIWLIMVIAYQAVVGPVAANAARAVPAPAIAACCAGQCCCGDGCRCAADQAPARAPGLPAPAPNPASEGATVILGLAPAPATPPAPADHQTAPGLAGADAATPAPWGGRKPQAVFCVWRT
jgi:hypothetical protein